MSALVEAIRTNPDVERILRKIRDSKPPHPDIVESYDHERAAAVRESLRKCEIHTFPSKRSVLNVCVRVTEMLQDRVIAAYAHGVLSETAMNANLDKAIRGDFNLHDILEKICNARPPIAITDEFDTVGAGAAVATLEVCGIEATASGGIVSVEVDPAMRRRVRSAFARAYPDVPANDIESWVETVRERQAERAKQAEIERRAVILDRVLAEIDSDEDEIYLECDEDEQLEVATVVEEETELEAVCEGSGLRFRIASDDVLESRKRARVE